MYYRPGHSEGQNGDETENIPTCYLPVLEFLAWKDGNLNRNNVRRQQDSMIPPQPGLHQNSTTSTVPPFGTTMGRNSIGRRVENPTGPVAASRTSVATSFNPNSAASIRRQPQTNTRVSDFANSIRENQDQRNGHFSSILSTLSETLDRNRDSTQPQEEENIRSIQRDTEHLINLPTNPRFHDFIRLGADASLQMSEDVRTELNNAIVNMLAISSDLSSQVRDRAMYDS